MDLNVLFFFLGVLASKLEMVANLAILYFAIEYIYNNMYVTIDLTQVNPNIKFKIKRKDINASNITNIVSKEYYKGDRIPPEVRVAIVDITNPKYKLQ